MNLKTEVKRMKRVVKPFSSLVDGDEKNILNALSNHILGKKPEG